MRTLKEVRRGHHHLGGNAGSRKRNEASAAADGIDSSLVTRLGGRSFGADWNCSCTYPCGVWDEFSMYTMHHCQCFGRLIPFLASNAKLAFLGLGAVDRSMSHLVMRARREQATAGSSGLRMIVGHYCCRRAARRQWHHLFCAIMSNYRKFEVKSRSVTFSLSDAGIGLRAHNDFMRNCSSTHVLFSCYSFWV